MIKVETPHMTIGELTHAIEIGSTPVRRSTHIGNQPPSELVIMSELPPGVDVMMVDTIQGNDRYSSPNMILKNHESIQLLSKNKSRDRAIGYCEAINPYTDQLDSLENIHEHALNQLNLNNRPMTMMKFFGQYPDILGAAISACLETDQINRIVRADGKITSYDPNASISDIYTGGKSTGILVPLNGMMAIDMAISNSLNSEKTLHLAGPDMIEYVRDDRRMEVVSELFQRICVLTGLPTREHIYSVIDSRGLGLIDERSQHELLETGTTIDLSQFHSQPTGLMS